MKRKRNKQLAMKALSASIGLVVIGIGAWMADSGQAHAETLILAGLAILGGLGTVALPRLTEPAHVPGEPIRRWRRASDNREFESFAENPPDA